MLLKRICAAVSAAAVLLAGTPYIYARDNNADEALSTDTADGILLDDCVDLEKAYAYSENLFAYTVPEEDYYAYDSDFSMFRRTSNTAESIEYEIKSGMYPIFYTYFKYTNEIPHFSFEVSDDGNRWQSAEADIKITQREDWKWIPVTYSLKNSLGDCRYVRIIYSEKSEVEWSPMLASVRVKYKNDGGNGFADTEGTEFENDAAKLKSLGIVGGYNEYEFRPYEEVSRAEFAKLNAEILALSKGGIGEQVFSDVAPESWSSAYVAALYRHGIINGDENRRFNPDGSVSFIEAAKMLVCSLGYSFGAENNGGYPDGYRLYAKRLGIDRGIETADENVPLSRGMCARMISNALEAELIYQKTYGDDAEYELSGTTILSEYLNIDRVEGCVNGAHGMAIISDIQGGENQVVIGDKTYETKKFDASALIGCNVKAYIKDGEILYAEAVNSAVLRINADEFYSIENGSLYYASGGEKSREITLNPNVRIILNGRYKSRVGVTDRITLDSGYLDVVYNGSEADLIIITSFKDYISASSARITDKITNRLGGTFEIDFDNAEYCRVTAYGEKTEADGLMVNKNDVISAAVSEDGLCVWVNVHSDTKRGRIDYIGENVISLDGVEYKIEDISKIGGEVSPGDEILAYLNLNGSIFATERYGGNEYVYLQSTGSTSVFGDRVPLRVINKEGEVKILYADDSTKFNGNKKKADKIARLTPQLLRIRKGGNDEVVSVETAVQNLGVTGEKDFTLAYKSDSAKYYGGALCVFASKYQLNADTPVFIIPKNADDTNAFEAVNRGALITDFDYKTEVFDVAEDYTVGAVVVYSDGSRERGVESYDPTGVILSSEVINNADREPCLKLTVYSKGEVGYVYFDNDGGEDKTSTWFSGYTPRDTSKGNNVFKAGEVIQYYSDSKSHCRSFRMMLTSEMIEKGSLYEKNTGDYGQLSNENYFSELYTANGVVSERFDNKLMLAADSSGDVLRTVPLSGSAVYVYDKKRQKLKIGNKSDIAQGDMIFVKMSYGDTLEIIVQK